MLKKRNHHKSSKGTFKRPGNKNQFNHNLEVLESLKTTHQLIDAGKYVEATDEIEKGKKLINKRQKLIRLPDRGKNGWHVVKEYVADDLASNSDDEKLISKARKSAATEKNSYSEEYKQKRRSNDRYKNSGYNQRFDRTSYDHRSSQENFKTDFRRNRYDRTCNICGK